MNGRGRRERQAGVRPSHGDGWPRGRALVGPVLRYARPRGLQDARTYTPRRNVRPCRRSTNRPTEYCRERSPEHLTTPAPYFLRRPAKILNGAASRGHCGIGFARCLASSSCVVRNGLKRVIVVVVPEVGGAE